MSKKRKLNSKNPKYWDKSLLKEPKVKKKVHNCTTKQGVKVYAVWYENELTKHYAKGWGDSNSQPEVKIQVNGHKYNVSEWFK